MPDPFDFSDAATDRRAEHRTPRDRREGGEAWPMSARVLVWVLLVLIAGGFLLGAGLLAWHLLLTPSDQQILDRANLAILKLGLRSIEGREKDPSWLPTRQECEDAYRHFVDQERILDRHPDWPIIGPAPSADVEAVVSRLERLARERGSGTWTNARKPGFRIGSAADFKRDVIDARAWRQ
jgi:hypothetical protein